METHCELLIRNIQSVINNLPLVDITTLPEDTGTQNVVKKIVTEQTQKESALVRDRIYSEFFGFGPITPLLDKPEITEILINNRNSIWFETKGTLHQHNDRFFSKITFNNFIQRLCKEANVVINLDAPFGNGAWGPYRLHIVSPPVAPDDYLVSLRQHPPNPWTFDRLLEQNWAPLEKIYFLKGLIANKKNFVIAGPTGSGKTSVINACLQHVAADERVIIIEDTPELVPPNPASAKIVTREDPHQILHPIDLTQLIRQTLRMRPDRIVMGEIRGPEAKDLLLSLSTGHAGSWGTLHASSPQQAMTRLEMLIQLGAPTWSVQAIRSLIHMSLDYIIVVNKDCSAKRVLTGIYRITALEECGFLLEQVC